MAGSWNPARLEALEQHAKALCRGVAATGHGGVPPRHVPRGFLSGSLALALKGFFLQLLICIGSYPYGGVVFTSSRGMTTLEREETRSLDFP